MKKKYLLSVVLMLCLGVVGCTASQIEAYITLAAQIAADALSITSAFTGSPVSAHDSTLITEWQTTLQSTVNSVEANKKAGNSTLLSISEAAETNLPQFLQAAQFDNPALGARVTAATDSFLQIVESIATIAGQPAPAVTTVTLSSGGLYRLPARRIVPMQDIVTGWNTNACPVASASCRAHTPTKTLLHPFSYR